jgi:hypothetical protein
MGHWCPIDGVCAAIDGVGPIDGVCAAIIGAGALLMVGEHTPHQWRWGGGMVWYMMVFCKAS